MSEICCFQSCTFFSPPKKTGTFSDKTPGCFIHSTQLWRPLGPNGGQVLDLLEPTDLKAGPSSVGCGTRWLEPFGKFRRNPKKSEESFEVSCVMCFEGCMAKDQRLQSMRKLEKRCFIWFEDDLTVGFARSRELRLTQLLFVSFT